MPSPSSTQPSHHLVLASSSPRRRELLQAGGFNLHVVSPTLKDEHIDPALSLEDALAKLVQQKLESIFSQPQWQNYGRVPWVAADTIVVLNNSVLGKPKDIADAKATLERLSGQAHEVWTAFIVATATQRWHQVVKTKVQFRTLSQPDIDIYLQSNEWTDKAGAYGIQGAAGSLIDRVEGSYTNIIGLPLAEVLATLKMDALVQR